MSPDLHISRFTFDLRELIVLEFLIERTVHRGRTTVRVPKREYITALTGISKGNLSAVINSLVNAGVIVVERQKVVVRGQDKVHECYTVRPASFWRLRPRVNWNSEKQALLDWLDNLPIDDKELLPEPEGLDRVLAEQALLTSGRAAQREGPDNAAELGTRQSSALPCPQDGSGDGHRRQVSSGTDPEIDWAQRLAFLKKPIAKAAVPDSGTKPFPRREPIGSQIGNQTVPESGTGAVQLNVQRLTASERQLNGEQLTGASGSQIGNQVVPRSGTSEAELVSQISELVGVDDMAAWGGDWRKNWVRVFPHHRIQAAINDVRSQIREGRQPTKAVGAWLKDTIRRFSHREAA